MSRRFQSRTFKVAFALFMAVGTCLFLEGASLAWLAFHGRPVDTFFLNFPREDQLAPAYQWDERSQVLTYVDPLLGIAMDPANVAESESSHPYEGFVIHPPAGTAAQTEPSPHTIVALGGSTTAPSKHDWPAVLSDMLESDDRPAHVLNGGVPGYSTSQELLKLLRDVLPMKPDVVLALNGINDAGFIHCIPSHPLLHRYQETLMAQLVQQDQGALLLPNARRAGRMLLHGDAWRLKGVSMGPPVTGTAAEQYVANIRACHALCREFDIEYISVLQPVMGIGTYAMSESEQPMYEELKDRPGYLQSLDEFYTHVIRETEKLPWVINATDLFQDTTNVYRDGRHQNEKGVRLIAQLFHDLLKQRTVISSASSSSKPQQKLAETRIK